MALDFHEMEAVRANLFPQAAAAVLGREDFPWHRDRTGAPTAAKVHSSQALAIDLFGTLQSLEDPTRVTDALIAHWQLALPGPWAIDIERVMPEGLLGEPRPTQVDAVMESPRGLVFFECKFTEEDGGACSQTRPLGGTSPNRGQVQCTGDYVMQVNPVNGVESRCALTGKGIGYWNAVPHVLAIENDVDHRPCPFRGGWYQWMRNLVACQVAASSSTRLGAFVVLYAEGPFSMPRAIDSADWRVFAGMAKEKEVPLRAESYQKVLKIAVAAACPTDAMVLRELGNWIDRKVTAAGGA